MQMDSAAEGGQGLNEAVKQIAMADRIIINKTDLVNEQGISAVSTRIRQINSAADIRTTRRSAVASDFILDLHAFDGKQIDPFASVNTGRHVVDKSVTTVSFVCDGLIDKQRLEKWGQTLLWESAITGASSMDKDPKESSLEILRLKALVYVDREFKHVFQAVYQTYDIQKGVKWTDDEPHRSQVVLIGRGLDYQKIYESFKKLVIAD